MAKLIFNKDDSFETTIDNDLDKKGLEKLAEIEFTTLSDFDNKIRKFNAHTSTNLGSVKSFLNPQITELPYTLKKLPVFYKNPAHKNSHPYGNYYIGNVEVID